MKPTLLFFLSLASFIYSQSRKYSDTIDVPFDKSVLIFFPDSIVDDDLGSNKYLYVKEKNKYKLGAVKREGPESSLYIETADGYYYYFLLRYNNSSHRPPIKMDTSKAIGRHKPKEEKKPTITIEVVKQRQKDSVNMNFKKLCENIISRPAEISNIGMMAQKVIYYLESVYVRGDKIYFQVSIENKSNSYYDIDFESFYIKSKKNTKIKDAVLQETKLEPIYVYNSSLMRIDGKSKVTKVFVFEKFTISNKKYINVELWEKNGERNIAFKISPNTVLQAKTF